MYAWHNLDTVEIYLTKLATNFYLQPSYLMGERKILIGL